MKVITERDQDCRTSLFFREGDINYSLDVVEERADCAADEAPDI